MEERFSRTRSRSGRRADHQYIRPVPLLRVNSSVDELISSSAPDLKNRLVGLDDITQQIGLRFIADEVRELFSAVIVDLEDFVVVGVLNQ